MCLSVQKQGQSKAVKSRGARIKISASNSVSTIYYPCEIGQVS